MGVGQLSESDAVDALRLPFYSSSHPTGSHGWRNQFDLGNPDCHDQELTWNGRMDKPSHYGPPAGFQGSVHDYLLLVNNCLQDIFQSGLVSWQYSPITKQRQGEPDGYLAIPEKGNLNEYQGEIRIWRKSSAAPDHPPGTGGRASLWRLSQSSSPRKCRFHLGFSLVVSITASDGNIRLTKPREILGASAKYGPVFGFLVIGRPDFVQDAINEAPAISRELKPYKLMTVSALAELYVLWREGKASPEQVESLLLEGDSYLNMDRVARLGGGQM